MVCEQLVNDSDSKTETTTEAKDRKKQIFVSFTKPRPIEVSNSTTIESIMQAVEKKEEIPIENQRMVYAGKPLSRELDIRSYSIPNGATISINDSRLYCNGGMEMPSNLKYDPVLDSSLDDIFDSVASESEPEKPAIRNQTIRGFHYRAMLQYIDQKLHPGDRPTKKADVTTKWVDLDDAVRWTCVNCCPSIGETDLVSVAAVKHALYEINSAMNEPWILDFGAEGAEGGSIGVKYHALAWKKGKAVANQLNRLSGGDYDPEEQPLVATQAGCLFSQLISCEEWYGRLPFPDRIRCCHTVLREVQDTINEPKKEVHTAVQHKRQGGIQNFPKVRTSLGSHVTINLSTPKKTETKVPAGEEPSTSPPSSASLTNCFIRDLKTAALAALGPCTNKEQKTALLVLWQGDILNMALQEITKMRKKVRLCL